ncbi:MAG TPA: LON peptidase substrate-binding domain-containing protein [Gaiellaceae bacterium]|jgi:ATP-dependent Lon protease
MEEIGLFPLGIVLLPGERVPLHIFEPRYRELIGECLDGEGEFGLVHADDDGVREIGTRARVAELLDRFDDGRMNVVVEGGERFRIVEVTSGRSFHTARIEPVGDDAGEPAPGDADRALGAFRALAEVVEAEPDEPDPGSPVLSFDLAGLVELPVAAKQELLELRSEQARLVRVAALLEDARRLVEMERELRERASRNGSRGTWTG